MRHSLPGIAVSRPSRNVSDLTNKNKDLLTTGKIGIKKAFGGRNLSMGITTPSDFPELPHKKGRGSANRFDSMQKMPEMMEALRRDPRALEMLIDEIGSSGTGEPMSSKQLRLMGAGGASGGSTMASLR